MSGPQPKLLLPNQYIAQATKLARHAKHHICLTSLSMFRDQATDKFIDAILDAARRGVSVHIAADFVTYIYAQHGIRPLLPFLLGSNNHETNQMAQDFRRAGANFSWLGRYTIPIFTGRTHSKWCVIDDTVFTFGGVNTEDIAITRQADYMLRVDDTKLAQILTREQRKIEAVNRAPQRRRNSEHKLAYGTLLLDDGQFANSTIYQHAVQLASQATNITLVSQYCPSGRLAHIIQGLGDNARIYFNQKNLTNDKINKILIGSKRLLMGVDNLYSRDRYIHAKFMICTMSNGEKVAITGSHNFTTAGSTLGTREIALLTHDPSIIRQLEQFLEKEIR